MISDSEKLNRELKFIEESFKSGIITKEEHDAAKIRVHEKLTIIKKEEEKLMRLKKEDKPFETASVEHEQTSIKNYQQIGKDDNPLIDKKRRFSEENIKLQTYGEKPFLRMTNLFIILVILMIIGIIVYSMNHVPEQKTQTFKPLCSKDLECQKKGLVGTCINPGTKDANCTYSKDSIVNITILNSKICVVCDNQRMRNTLLQLYPNARFVEIDSESTEGKQFIKKLDIEVLPAYIFDKSVEKSYRFLTNSSSAKSTLVAMEDYYIMTPEAAGSIYFINNDIEPKTIILFFNPFSTTSLNAFENLMTMINKQKSQYSLKIYVKEDRLNDTERREIYRELCIREDSEDLFLNYLKCVIPSTITENAAIKCMDDEDIAKSSVEKCIENNGKSLLMNDLDSAKEFFINTVPIFIINNQYKKGGSLSADILEDMFCTINKGVC